MEPVRVLAIVTEPWEATLVVRAFNDNEVLKANTQLFLLISDPYSFVYQPAFISSIQELDGVNVKTIQERFLTWQSDGAPPDDPADAIEWLGEYCNKSTSQEIEFASQTLHAWEWSATLKHVSDEWARYIFLDCISHYLETYAWAKPNFIVTIGQRSVFARIAYQMKDTVSTPMFTLVQSRIGRMWTLRPGFAFGMESREAEELANLQLTQAESQWVAEIHRGLVESGYLSGRASHDDMQRLRRARSQRVSREAKDLLGVTRKIAARVKHRAPLSRSIRTRRFDQHLGKLSIFELRISLTRLALACGLLRPFRESLPQTKFILWCLHLRPEDSSSVLAKGQDELESVLRFADMVGPELSLVVKEHPFMLGLRDRHLYRRLSQRGIWLLNPRFPTVSAIEQSSGVAGIAGTVLLEAAALRKPTLALGLPEFGSVVDFHGWSNARDFLRRATAGASSLDPMAFDKYIAYLRRISVDQEFDFMQDLDGHDGVRFTTAVSQEFARAFHLAAIPKSEAGDLCSRECD